MKVFLYLKLTDAYTASVPESQCWSSSESIAERKAGMGVFSGEWRSLLYDGPI